MSDRVVEVSEQGWFSRIFESIKSVLVGAFMFLIAIPLLWWNEGRAVQTYKSLSEGAGAVVSVPADKVDASKEGKLIHLTGKVQSTETLADPLFGISTTGVRLERHVEVYQWVEEKSEKKRKKLGGGEETVTTYDYKKDWAQKLSDSSKFKEPVGHTNPRTAVAADETWRARAVNVGAFKLSDSLIDRVPGEEKFAVTQSMLSNKGLGATAKIDNGGLYMGRSAASPEIGDVRIRYERVPAGSDVSIIAAQRASALAPYQTRAGDALELVQAGTKTSGEMFKQAESTNATMTWILRFVFFIVMAVGIFTVFRPLAVVADVVPIFGDILRGGLGFVSVAIATPITFFTIALAWVFYRPVVGVGLLVVGVGVFFLVRQLAKKRGAPIPVHAH
jgi:hypothetical protein